MNRHLRIVQTTLASLLMMTPIFGCSANPANLSTTFAKHPSASPTALVEKVFKIDRQKGLLSASESKNKIELPKYFDRRLSNLLVDNCALGKIDYDPFYGGQDLPILKNFAVKLLTSNEHKATVVVSFENYDTAHKSTVYLNKETAGWKITDVKDNDAPKGWVTWLKAL